MGLYITVPPSMVEILKYKKKVIANNGFKPIKGWTKKSRDEFHNKYKYYACYERDGKVYGEIQVETILGLTYTGDSEFSIKMRNRWFNTSPVDIVPWLEAKNESKNS